MKSKILFSALGLSVAFAACTNEDIMEANVSNTALEGRKIVDMELVTELGSRANAAGWESTDKIGSVLVDPTTMWDVEPAAHHGNNRWDYNGSAFTTQGTTVEGAWMFYYPYSAAMSKERGALKAYKSIVNQEYDATGDKMYANDFAVSPVYYVNAAEGGAKVDVILNSVYSYGNIKAALPEAASGAKVSKVLLRYETGFADSLAINAETVAKLAAMNYAYTTSTATEANPDGKTPQALTGTIKQWWNCDSTQTSLAQTAAARNGLRNYTKGTEGYVTEGMESIATNGGTTTSDYILIDCSKSTALADTMFSTRVLLPAGVVTDMIEVFIYTDKGVFGDTIQNANGLYFKRGLKADLHNVNRVADTETVKQPTHLSMVVANAETTPIVETADLVNLIKQFNPATADVMDVTDQLMGSVVFNDAVAEALEANAKITKLLVENINITCTKAQTVSKLYAEGNVAVKAGSSITVKGNWGAKNLTIESGASVVVAGSCGYPSSTTTVKGNLTINNKVDYNSSIVALSGELTLGNVLCDSASHQVKVWLSKVETGKFTVNAPVKIQNSGASSWGTETAKAEALTVDINQNVEATTINVLKNATITNDATLGINNNAGTIDNNKILTVAENAGTINNKVSVITTNGKVVVTENAATGTINTVADSQTDVDTNNGIIYYAEDAFINGTFAGSHEVKGNIIYKVAADMTAAQLAAKIQQTKVTAIEIASAKLTVEDGFEKLTALAKLRNIALKGTAEVVANDTVALANCPIYVSGTANVISGTAPIAFVAGAGTDYCKIDLAEGATIEVKTVIWGVEKINLGKNAKVIARTNVYGPNTPESTVIHLSTGASWLGTAFEQKVTPGSN